MPTEVWQVKVRSTLPEDRAVVHRAMKAGEETMDTKPIAWFGEMEFEAETQEEAVERAIAAEKKMFPRNEVELVWARKKGEVEEKAKALRREAVKRDQAKREKRKRKTARRRARRGHPRNGGGL